MLPGALKDKNSSHNGNERQSVFQTIMIELYKQPKNTNTKEHLGLVISSIRVGVVAKTDDGVYILNTIKIYSDF